MTLVVGFLVGAAVAFPLGLWLSDHLGASYWRRYGFCATCSRLDCAREH